jgi:hypothetical protein
VVQAPLKALLIDVGGTLVDDATWIERAEYEALIISRLDEAFGVRIRGSSMSPPTDSWKPNRSLGSSARWRLWRPPSPSRVTARQPTIWKAYAAHAPRR